MLTVEQARVIADQWRERFQDQESFELSWSRFFDMTGDPTADKLERWLAKDQSRDAIKHAGIVREPLVPVRQRHQLNNCRQCWSPEAGGGLRYVRRDVGVDHPEFGRALRCPRCNT